MTHPVQAHHFSVSGMSCQGCVKSVERLILKHDPAAAVTVSLERAEAVVTSQLPAQSFTEALTKAGFPAQMQ
jgi:copper chaperone CopZ